MAYKQIPVADHATPKHSEAVLNKSFRSEVVTHYGHLFTVCPYCGLYHHKQYVCSCGVDIGYLEDENGSVVHPLVEVYLVPVKEKDND